LGRLLERTACTGCLHRLSAPAVRTECPLRLPAAPARTACLPAPAARLDQLRSHILGLSR